MVNPGCSSYLGGRAPSIPEGQDLSRSSSNASSFASVVEDNETEATEDYDTGMVSALFSVFACKKTRQAPLKDNFTQKWKIQSWPTLPHANGKPDEVS